MSDIEVYAKYMRINGPADPRADSLTDKLAANCEAMGLDPDEVWASIGEWFSGDGRQAATHELCTRALRGELGE